MNSSKHPGPRQIAWAARKAAEVRRQIQESEPLPAGSSWRERQRKAASMAHLHDREARYRRLASHLSDDSDLPF